MKNDSLKEQYRINERIRVREVRLVGDNVCLLYTSPSPRDS